MKDRGGVLIEVAIRIDDWQSARTLIRNALKRDPLNHWLLSRLALTYYEQKQYRRALHYDIKALQIAPYCPLAIWGYAGTLDMLERSKEALVLFKWLVSCGEPDLAYGDCGEGIRAARSLIADCYYRIAQIQEESGQRKKALAAYAEHLARRRRGTRSIYPLREVRARYKKLASAIG
jgi:predicted Zn-dependent protease